MSREEEYQNALNGYMNLDVKINKTLRLIGISAIKKQIPKKVLRVKGDTFALSKDGKESYFVHLKCPSCGVVLCSDWKFCFECGQALDWSEEDD